ncbi:MAG TPA: 16S rRNA (adenine(1518)-N(6)/adenine(1519)-N(6))-dimethyltransferase RsmA [Patescibacteria group bacterium]|nr:16S rRNA (adenine(1518)-N(6)/adenine(1519)-N(6))-dimethyltransferase RsmA [Patescibacteria group bacterium]
MTKSLRPKKSLGQHWLKDEDSLLKICQIAKLTKNDVILEVGPGEGDLTKNLIDQSKKVIAVELDNNLTIRLIKKFKNLNNLQVLNENILDFDFSTLPMNYKIVANIPYYLTSNFIRKISETKHPPSTATLLVQKEVAQRITAKPGNMSLLSVTCQYYWDTKLGDLIPASKFSPVPKVDSQIVHLTRQVNRKIDNKYEKELFKIVRAGFSAKRKKLINSLSSNLKINKDQLSKILVDQSIDPNTRPQNLSLEDWIRVYSPILDVLSKNK